MTRPGPGAGARGLGEQGAGHQGAGHQGAEMLTGQADLVDCLYLVRNGVPFDVAFSLSPSDRLAWVVVLGELDGHRWDWQRREWRAPG